MVGDIFKLGLLVWVIGIFAFAPLGYFIYMYTMKSGEPFGDIEPHGDHKSKILDMAALLIYKIKRLIAKK